MKVRLPMNFSGAYGKDQAVTLANPALAANAAFLIDEQVITSNGEGAPIAVGALADSVATVTFGVMESQEQQSIEVVVLRSKDGEVWDETPVLTFPQRFYAGTSAMILDLRKFPDTAFLKAKWTVNRWGRGSLTPQFRAYVFVRT
jgi:hypothetical protein